MIRIFSAEYIKGSTGLHQCPPAEMPEYAFIGRSNVGKSSLINMITGYRKLAKISATPGKTQLINHFSINSDWYLTDLPGYGFARVSKSVKKDWDKMICEYLSGRKNLMYTFVLIDPRIPPQGNDQHFIHWLGTQHIPFVIVFTKCDKLGLAEIQSNLSAWKKQLLETWEDLPTMIYTSSRFGKGRDEILQLIQKTNRLFRTE